MEAVAGLLLALLLGIAGQGCGAETASQGESGKAAATKASEPVQAAVDSGKGTASTEKGLPSDPLAEPSGWSVMGFFVGQSVGQAVQNARKVLTDIDDGTGKGYLTGKGTFEGVQVDVTLAIGEGAGTVCEITLKFADAGGSERAGKPFKDDPLTVAMLKAVGRTPSWNVADEASWGCPGAFFAHAQWEIGDARIDWSKEWGCAKGETSPGSPLFSLRAYSTSCAERHAAEVEARAEADTQLKKDEERKMLEALRSGIVKRCVEFRKTSGMAEGTALVNCEKTVPQADAEGASSVLLCMGSADNETQFDRCVSGGAK